MENHHTINVFLKKMSDLYQQSLEGIPISNLLPQIVQYISIFIGCNTEQTDVRNLLHLISKLLSDQPQTDSKENSFSREFLIRLASLEKMLRGAGEPLDIIKACLKSALNFYQADSVSIVETNLSTMTGWMLMEESNDGGYMQFYDTKQVVRFTPEKYPTMYHAISNNHGVSLDINSNLLTSDEIGAMKRLDTTFAAVAPFQKRKTGYVILRNPHKWIGYNELLQMLSYVIVSELNEMNLLNDLVLAAENDSDHGEHDITIQCFGLLKIKTQNHNAFCPKTNNIAMRILIYITMNRRRSVTQEELIDAIWGNTSGMAGTAGNLRTSLSRARSDLNEFYPHPYIITDENGSFHLSHDVRLHLDTELFEAYFSEGMKLEINNQRRITYLMKAYKLYQGDFLEGHKVEDEWIERRRTHYIFRYEHLLMALLPLLYEEQMYMDAFEVALQGLKYEPESSIFNYYLVQSLIKQGMYDQARKHFYECQKYLKKHDYEAFKCLL